MKYEGKIYGKIAGKYIPLEQDKDDTEMLRRTVTILSDLYEMQNGPPLIRYRKQWEEVMAAADKLLTEWQNKNHPPQNHPNANP